MATAIFARDMINQVTKRCPTNTPIPSEAWVRLNFSPKNPWAKVSAHYQGNTKVKTCCSKDQPTL